MIVLVCAALSGAMFYLSQGLDNLWGLAWIAPVPLLWLAYGGTSRWRLFAASLAAFAAGQIYFLQCYALLLPVTVIGAMLGNGLLFACIILLARRVRQALPAAAALFAFPAFWTAAEYLESLLSPHGAWVTMGYTQAAWPATIQIASLFGVAVITFTLCLFANALALAASGEYRIAAIGVVLCLLAPGFGYLRLHDAAGKTVKVATLADWQGRAAAVHRLDFAATHAMAETYASAAGRQADRGARLIVIPEAAMTASPEWQARALQPLADIARQKRVTIVAGVQIVASPWRNAALIFQPDGALHEYDKRHLLLPGEARNAPGTAPGLLGDGRAVAICKDLDFPRTLRSDALAAAEQGGIRLLAVPANDFVKDGWIHARQAILRGVENGFAVVRSAFNGLETVSDAQGRILARASTTNRGMVVRTADVALGPGPTLYTRMGDVFAWLCLAISLGFVAVLLKRQRGPS